MKNAQQTVRRVFSFMCALVLLLSSINVVFAAESAESAVSPFHQEFETILNEEDSLISDCASELNELFVQDPEEFLYALSLEEPGSQETIINLL